MFAPQPDPATLSVAFYLQSACCPYVTLIVAIILVQQGSCFISPEYEESGQECILIKPLWQHTNGLTLRYLHRDELRRAVLT